MLIQGKSFLYGLLLLLIFPFSLNAATTTKSIVVFGDSMSDTGNLAKLLKSLRKDESPAYLVRPVKVYTIQKMNYLGHKLHLPDFIIKTGVNKASDFLDFKVAPTISNLVGKLRKLSIVPSEPYWKHHFSNGKVWFEYLAPMLGVDRDENTQFVNKAFGGSWAMTYDHKFNVLAFIKHPMASITRIINGKLIPPSLGLTVQAYVMENPKLDKDTSYFIFSGSNDYINSFIYDDAHDTNSMSKYINKVLKSIKHSVEKLYQAGGRRFMIMGIPHIGDTPAFNQSSNKDLLNMTADIHNKRLNLILAKMRKTYPDMDIVYINTQEMFSKALNNKEEYGFTNINDACIDTRLPMIRALTTSSPFTNNFILQYQQQLQYNHPQFRSNETNYHICDNPNKYLFWDVVHVTTKAHNLLAFEICSILKENGYAAKCSKPA